MKEKWPRRGPDRKNKAAYSFGITKPEKKSYIVDVAIVGGGPGGYVAAVRAAQGGTKGLLSKRTDWVGPA